MCPCRSASHPRLAGDPGADGFPLGVAQYAAPEALFGADFVTSAYCRTPEGSRRRMLRHLRAILPDVPEGELLALLQG